MAKKQAPAKTVDDVNEPIEEAAFTPAIMVIPELQSLVASGIVTVENDRVIWREGHLQHVARAYAANLEAAWRNYNDDLKVAFLYCGEEIKDLIIEASSQ